MDPINKPSKTMPKTASNNIYEIIMSVTMFIWYVMYEIKSSAVVSIINNLITL